MAKMYIDICYSTYARQTIKDETRHSDTERGTTNPTPPNAGPWVYKRHDLDNRP